MDALAFLDKAAKSKPQPVYVLVGDEDFLKARCRAVILGLTLGEAEPDFAVSVYAGETLDWSTVRNDLDTMPFLAPARIVVVDLADTFVTEHRPALERYVAAPSPVGVLILDVKTFPESTKLAKALPDAAKLVCKSPAEGQLPAWCSKWSQLHHGKKLAYETASLLVERVGTTLGLLDSELGKLAAAIGDRATIEPGDVDRLVTPSRAADVFKILDAVGEGKPDRAFTLLAQLFEDRQDPLAILGAWTYQLRKLATVGRLLNQGQALGPAMDTAGVPSFPRIRETFDRQIRHLGRRRLDRLPEWLVEINSGLKGGSVLPPRVQLERFLAKLARPREA